MRKEEGIIAVVIIGLALLFTFVLNIQFTGLVVFDQSNQTHFDEGTYVNTTYNGSAIVLNESQTNGKYTSKIFDAGEESSWDSLTWNGSAPSTVTNSLPSPTRSTESSGASKVNSTLMFSPTSLVTTKLPRTDPEEF
ncbi:MAG TPA: hypothetical protein ENH99_00220 [Candidatus Pacearchaeota archaeon]|nr:hypothetical protein [Candidatus Pacearchaeota archaeon]